MTDVRTTRAGDAPALVLVTGLQGTGKSAIAGGVAEALHAPLLAWDWLMAGLTSFEPVQDAFRAMGREEYRSVGWALMFQLARLQLGSGLSVLLDGLARDREIAATRSLATELGVRSLVVLTCCHDVTLQRTRVEGRRRDIPGWHELRWSDVERTRSRWTPSSDVDVEFDERGTVAEHIAAVLARLRA
jgi:predicted kinase